VKFNFAAEAGGGGASMAAAAQTSQKSASPCYFAVAYHCLKVQLVDDDSRPVKKCPMLAQDRCSQPHDAATCKSVYAGDEGFKKNLDSYVEVAKANGNKVPSKEQLQDAGVLPKWTNERFVRSSKGTGGRGGGGRGRGGRAQGRGEGNANMSGGGSPSTGKAKFDPTRAVVVFAGTSQGHQVAVLDPKDVLTEGALYVSTAGSAVPKAGEAADMEDSRIEKAAGTYGQADPYVPPQCSESLELERLCTCCRWCSGSLE
jgi:hypothetical protein